MDHKQITTIAISLFQLCITLAVLFVRFRSSKCVGLVNALVNRAESEADKGKSVSWFADVCTSTGNNDKAERVLRRREAARKRKGES